MVVAQRVLILTEALAFLGQVLITPRVRGRTGLLWGHLILVVARPFPECMLTCLFLQVFGPSMLPAVLALVLHNGAIIAHRPGRQAAGLPLRPDAPRGLSLWGWEIVPRLFGNFIALCLCRWQISIRESAIMGILGVSVDALSRTIRSRPGPAPCKSAKQASRRSPQRPVTASDPRIYPGRPSIRRVKTCSACLAVVRLSVPDTHRARSPISILEATP